MSKIYKAAVAPKSGHYPVPEHYLMPRVLATNWTEIMLIVKAEG